MWHGATHHTACPAAAAAALSLRPCLPGVAAIPCPAAGALMKKRRRVATAALMGGGHPSSAVGAPAGEGGMALGKNQGAFRFWFDERRFKGPGRVCVVHEALYAACGVRTGGYPKASPVAGPLGWQRPGDWDLLWSPVRVALKAVPYMKAGQLICACPGLMSLSRKRKLPMTLAAALGAGAWAILPRSFSLPDQLPALGEAVGEMQAAGQGQELWMLKTAQHLGKGLRLLPAGELVAEATRGSRGAGAAGSAAGAAPSSKKPYVLAQKYVADPLLIDGRKFGVRVWVVVLGPNPLRAYIHGNGLVLFATTRYDTEQVRGAGGSVALGHVTNYAMNVDGRVWDLGQLKAHLGDSAFAQMWDRISRAAARMCAAALPHIIADHEALKLQPESTFELLGLDFLVDSQLHPWLLEVNGTPSLAVDHCEPHVEQLICDQKAAMVQDMFKLLGISTRFKPRYEALRLAAQQVTARQAAAAGAGARASPRPAAGADEDTDEEGEHDQVPVKGNNSAASVGPAQAAAAAAPVLLPKRLRDALNPRSDAAMHARVVAELQNRGGFQPLMPLFPIPDELVSVQGSPDVGLEPDKDAAVIEAGQLTPLDLLLRAPAVAGAIPWAARDIALRLQLDIAGL